MTWSFRHVDWRPKHGSLSTIVWPSLNRLYQSLICVVSIAPSPKAVWIFWMVSTWLLTSFWQNLMQYRCFSRSAIFLAMKNQQKHYTLPHSNAACQQLTLSTGGKNFMCTNVQDQLVQMHMIQTHQVFAKTNKVRYFSNRPRTLVVMIWLGCHINQSWWIIIINFTCCLVVW